MYGTWSSLLTILVAVVVLDYLTGIISAWINESLNSQYGLKGIATKVLIFSLVSVGHFVDMLLGNGPFIREVVIIFYITNELISIIENAGKAGLPLPRKLSKAVKVLKEKKPRLK
ncbi:holin family protein [Salipaludibacillus sp. HK11]|uniref:phage holin family protein n=1 Tax=Salipaludibacillus sp. HK11 TaxID=3394320 RepID=UPI0039FCB200